MPAPPPTTSPQKPALHFDWTEWLPYIEEGDLSEAQKQKMIETLWSIVLTFVDLGWEVGHVPQESRGQVPDLRAALATAVVHSKEAQTEEVL